MMYDRDKLVDRAGSTELLVRLITKLHDIIPRSLGQLESSLEGGDGAALERQAHSLRGALTTFEAPEPVALTRQLEHLGLEGNLAPCRELLEQLRVSTSRLLVELAELAKNPPVL